MDEYDAGVELVDTTADDSGAEVDTGAGKSEARTNGGVRSLPAFGGPLKSPALQASWIPLHLDSQIGQFLLPVGPAEL